MREDTYLKNRRANREAEMQNATDLGVEYTPPPRIKRSRAKAKRVGWKKLAERLSRGGRQMRAERDKAVAELERVAKKLEEISNAAKSGG